MMKCRRSPHHFFLWLALVLLFCGGCQKAKIADCFIRQRIIFPSKFLVVENGSIRVGYFEEDVSPKLVYFFGHTDCSECQIVKLTDLLPIFQKAETEGRFLPLIIFAPDAEHLESTLNALKKWTFPHSVYVSMENEWVKESGIPEDPQYHTFLMNRDRLPVFVGNPLESEKMMKLFENHLETKKR